MSDPYGPKRDRWGRYLLPDPYTGKERAWTRATTLSSSIADTYGLTRWQMRMVAKGLGMRPDLLALAAAAHVDDKTTLDRVAADAKEAAGSSAGANAGTALHSFTEAVDRGEDVTVPAPWDADVAAYRRTLAEYRITTHPEWVERITIVPEYSVAGTLDRIVTLPDGRQVIADVKTGKDLSYSWPEIAIQLALYANASHVWGTDRDLGDWEAMPDLDKTEAVVMWLPVGQAKCELFTVDIAAGWEMAALAYHVRQWRARKNLARPMVNPAEVAERLRRHHDPLRLRAAIKEAETVDALVHLWAEADAAGTWTPEMTALAADRKRALLTGQRIEDPRLTGMERHSDLSEWRADRKWEKARTSPTWPSPTRPNPTK